MPRYRYSRIVSHAVTPSRGTAFWAPGDGRVIAIADGTVVSVGETQGGRVGVGVMVAHPAIGKWAYYDYLAEVTVSKWARVRRGDTLGFVVRWGHVRGLAPSEVPWKPRVSLELCEPGCEKATEDPLPVIDTCIGRAREGDVVFPVRCP